MVYERIGWVCDRWLLLLEVVWDVECGMRYDVLRLFELITTR